MPIVILFLQFLAQWEFFGTACANHVSRGLDRLTVHMAKNRR